MIRVRRGAYLYSELKLEASSSEFSELRSLLLSFCEATEHAIEVPSELQFDPRPYYQKLGRLHVCKTADALLISVADGRLFISGKPRFLRLFAESLPCDTPQTSTVPYHVHFERVGEECISYAALDIILMPK